MKEKIPVSILSSSPSSLSSEESQTQRIEISGLIHIDSNDRMDKLTELGEASSEKDEKKRLDFYHKAADQTPGNREAQFYLAEYYRKHSNNFTDATASSEMFKYYKLAANHSADDANCFRLAECYENGWGVAKNQTEAERLYKIVVAESEFAANDFFYKSKIRLAQYLESSDPHKAVAEYIQILTKYTASEVHLHLAQCYEEGRGIEKDEVKALEHYRCAKKNHVQAKKGIKRLELKAAEELLQALEKFNEAKAIKMRPVKVLNWTSESRKLEKELESQSESLFREAFHLLTSAAQKGNLEAMYQLGLCYQLGEGVEKNNIQANVWFKKLLSLGYAPVQFYIGKCFEQGIDTIKDNKKAAEFYLKAANQSHTEAMYHLGLCYEKGTGIEKNLKNALRFYRLAAEQGHVEAHYLSGVYLLEQGKGEEKNVQQAMIHFRSAELQGHEKAKKALQKNANYYLEQANEHFKDSTHPKIIRDVETGVVLLSIAADANKGHHPQAQYQLAQCYQKGIGVQKDDKKAMQYFALAAHQQHTDAQLELALYYANKLLPYRNDLLALPLLQAAADKNHPLAQFYLGRFYEVGIGGLDQNLTEALRLFQLSAGQGCGNAQNKLAECYEKGISVKGTVHIKPNLKSAIKFYQLAAKQKTPHISALNNLGRCYEEGIGVSKNLSKAVDLYRTATLQKGTNSEAPNNLGRCYRDGIGIEANPAMAKYFFDQAKIRGSVEAIYNLAECYQKGQGVKIDEKKAQALYYSAATRGHLGAQKFLGKHYFKIKNEEKGEYYLHLAADQNDADAQYELAEFLLESDGDEAIEYFKLAASQNHTLAILMLARIYENGEYGQTQDLAEAMKYYIFCADKGNALALNKLGECNEKKGNNASAFDYYSRAAKNGDPVAQYHVGRFYQEGIEVKKDFKQAIVWFEKAQVQTPETNISLAYRLGRCYQNIGHLEKAVEQYEKVKLIKPKRDHTDGISSYMGALISLGVRYQEGTGGKQKDEQEAAKHYLLAQRYAEKCGQEPAELFYRLGFCYEQGWGEIAKNDQQAKNLYESAADKGHADAQFRLAIFYETGLGGLSINHSLALRFYEMAASNNHPAALRCLGKRAEATDLKIAVRYYQAAVHNGDIQAQYLLGSCYEAGKGIKKDAKEAVKLYQVAAQARYPDAQYALGLCYKNGLGVKIDLQKAVDWCQAASKNNHCAAQRLLGDYYASGVFISDKNENTTTVLKADQQEAMRLHDLAEKAENQARVRLYKKEAREGSASAQYFLGVSYEHGIGIEKNEIKAVKCYKLAAEQGHPMAQNNYAYCLDRGVGTTKDVMTALHYYHLASNQGHTTAKYNLGLHYSEGAGVEKDDKKAVDFYRSSANANHRSRCRLAECYENGWGVDKDSAEAKRLYRSAAKDGNTEAQAWLDKMPEQRLMMRSDTTVVPGITWFNQQSKTVHDRSFSSDRSLQLLDPKTELDESDPTLRLDTTLPKELSRIF